LGCIDEAGGLDAGPTHRLSSQRKLGPIYPPAPAASWVPAFAGM